jgi:hypothetical protein
MDPGNAAAKQRLVRALVAACCILACIAGWAVLSAHEAAHRAEEIRRRFAHVEEQATIGSALAGAILAAVTEASAASGGTPSQAVLRILDAVKAAVEASLQ